jgi:hypothetical protein
MKGIVIRRLYQKREDDCFPTAVRCITGIDDVPLLTGGVRIGDLQKEGTPWYIWKKVHGYEFVIYFGRDYPEEEYYIGFIKPLIAPKNAAHAVVCFDGRVVHDVCPQEQGLDPKGHFVSVQLKKP